MMIGGVGFGYVTQRGLSGYGWDDLKRDVSEVWEDIKTAAGTAIMEEVRESPTYGQVVQNETQYQIEQTLKKWWPVAALGLFLLIKPGRR